MAITAVPVQPVQKTQRQRKPSPLGIAGSALGAVGGFATGNPVMGGAGLIGLAQELNPPRITEVSRGAGVPNISGAAQRRMDLSQSDPIQALTEARNILAASDFDAETRARLEAPILKALQAGRA